MERWFEYAVVIKNGRRLSRRVVRIDHVSDIEARRQFIHDTMKGGPAISVMRFTPVRTPHEHRAGTGGDDGT